MSDIVQKLLSENKRLYDSAKNPLRTHGPDHHLRVYHSALRLAEKTGLNYDSEILAGAALLHDLAAYYPHEVGDAYHEHDHVIAREALERIGFPPDKVEATLAAIKNHGSDPKYKVNDETVEATLLRDADKLDAFGAIGCARIVMVRTLKGDTLQGIVDDFWTQGHLERKWSSITTDATREMAHDDYEYSRQFFEKLVTSLRDER